MSNTFETDLNLSFFITFSKLGLATIVNSPKRVTKSLSSRHGPLTLTKTFSIIMSPQHTLLYQLEMPLIFFALPFYHLMCLLVKHLDLKPIHNVCLSSDVNSCSSHIKQVDCEQKEFCRAMINTQWSDVEKQTFESYKKSHFLGACQNNFATINYS